MTPLEKHDEQVTHRVTLALDRGYQFDATFEGGHTIRFDEPAPLGEGEAPNAAALLAAAVANCLAASLLFCLRRSRATVKSLTAEVTMNLARNEKGRYRIRDIDVQLTPEVAEMDGGRLGRCEDLFEDFCVVTESVRAGIPISVAVKEAEREPA